MVWVMVRCVSCGAVRADAGSLGLEPDLVQHGLLALELRIVSGEELLGVVERVSPEYRGVLVDVEVDAALREVLVEPLVEREVENREPLAERRYSHLATSL